MKEQWKEIPFYENYLISSFGRIKTKHGNFLKLMGNTKRNPYFTVELKGKKVLVHRLMLMAFIGMPNEGQIVCHRNDIKTDNRLNNLYWGSHKENKQDGIRNGKFGKAKSGEHHHNVKYSDEVISKIKNEYTGKYGEQTALGRKYGMPQQQVYAIVSGKIRRKLTSEIYH